MLTVNHLSVSIDHAKILSDISFSIQMGKNVGVIGGNGAGKSTLLKAIAGDIKPVSGTIRMSINGLQARQKAWLQHMGFCPDTIDWPADLTVDAFIKMIMAFKSVPQSDFARIIEDYHLRELLSKHCVDLSKGQAQRLLIAQAMLGSPHLLLLDEPFQGLDDTYYDWLYERLRDHADNRIVLVSGHHISQWVGIVDYIVCLDNGRMEWAGNVGRTQHLVPERFR